MAAKNLFPRCSKELIASAMPVEDPRTHEFRIYMIRPIMDYVIMKGACALDLIPSPKAPRDYELLEKYYREMSPYAVVLGYSFSGALERPHVELASKHGLVALWLTSHLWTSPFTPKCREEGNLSRVT